MKHAKQHYVPGFLLSRWEVDKKVWRYSKPHESILIEPSSVRSCAWDMHLYSVGDTQNKDTYIESEFLSPLDNDASLALEQIENDGLPSIQDSRFALAWQRFLFAQLYRSPRMVALSRARGRHILERNLDFPDAEELASLGMTPQQHIEFAKTIPNHSYDDLGVQIMPQLIKSPRAHSLLKNSTWVVMNFDDEVLIGDHPLIYKVVDSNAYIMGLPIGPNKYFFSYKGDLFKQILSQDKDVLLHGLNLGAVQSSRRMIVARSRKHDQLILNNFEPRDPVHGLLKQEQ
ncbi:DUF4238 domain-containing protein [Xylophilus sp. Leaf220]|uniref:DUF4238 domain-containing protein n=1 Tax=Xylophilus sp. Leaf220 TaxID=1735686 RepID=UPI001443F481|nr:DUF4238 domain-containing protein [Xylophilus sp. Leaf220]